MAMRAVNTGLAEYVYGADERSGVCAVGETLTCVQEISTLLLRSPDAYSSSAQMNAFTSVPRA